MNIEVYEEAKLPIVVIRDFYEEHELASIWRTLDSIDTKYLMMPWETGTARDGNGAPKRNTGIFLNQIINMENAQLCNLLRETRKIYNYTNELIEVSQLFYVLEQAKGTNRNGMLISYYENGDSYFPHRDHSNITILYWFNRNPKSFTGGDMRIGDTVIDYADNSVVLFPSVMEHEVGMVSMQPSDCRQGLGRYCVTEFVNL
jgi:hypothetical protein